MAAVAPTAAFVQRTSTNSLNRGEVIGAVSAARSRSEGLAGYTSGVLLDDTTEEKGALRMPELEDQLVKYIGEAHAMEQSVLRLLDDMIGTTDDPEIQQELQHHREATERHAARMEDCLASYGESPSRTKEVGGMLGALMKSAVDVARGDKAGRNARDSFATEHLEIASYELLERIAQKAGDEETAQAARENRADEEAMAQKIASNWDKFAELSLTEQGITA